MKIFAGEKLGIAYTDAKMGPLSMNAVSSILMTAKTDNTIALNIRYPQGTDPETIKSTLEKIEGVATVSFSAHGHTPHYVPMDDELVSTLLRVTKNKLASKDMEQVIGGIWTFCRLLKRGGCLWCYVPRLCQYHAPS